MAKNYAINMMLLELMLLTSVQAYKKSRQGSGMQEAKVQAGGVVNFGLWNASDSVEGPPDGEGPPPCIWNPQVGQVCKYSFTQEQLQRFITNYQNDHKGMPMGGFTFMAKVGKPQGILGPLPKGWQEKFLDGEDPIFTQKPASGQVPLGSVDTAWYPRAPDPRSSLADGGVMTFQMSGDGPSAVPDNYPIGPEKNALTGTEWVTVPDADVARDHPGLFAAVQQQLFKDGVLNPRLAAMGKGMTFAFKQQLLVKAMVRPSEVILSSPSSPVATFPTNDYADKNYGVKKVTWRVHGMMGNNQDKELDKNDAWFVLEDFIKPSTGQSISGKDATKVAAGSEQLDISKGVYLCQEDTDRDGLPIGHVMVDVTGKPI